MIRQKSLKPTRLSLFGFRKSLNRFLDVALVALVASSSLAGQSIIPDAGNLHQDAEQSETLKPAIKTSTIVDGADSRDAVVAGGPKVKVTRYRFPGSTSIPVDELERMAEPYRNRLVSFSEISVLLENISALYRERGFLARVFLPEQDIQNGVVQVTIIEAKFGDIRFEGATPNSSERGERHLTGVIGSGQATGELLNLQALERAALLSSEYPGLSPKVVLSAGEQIGFTDIVVVADKSASLSATTLVDNYGSRSTGALRFTGVGQAANTLGQGELIQFNALISEGNRYGALNLQYPIGYRGLAAGLSASLLDYDLVGDFESLNASGEAFAIDLNLSYPLIRSSRNSLDVKARFGRRDYTNTQAGRTVSDKVIDATRIELHGQRSDDWMSGGGFFYGVDATRGDLDLSGYRLNQAFDEISAQTEGSYTVLGWRVGRQQRLTQRDYLKATLQGQWASKSLDSSETFVLGGPSRVRAYPILEGTGDDGILASVELSHRLRDNLTVSTFFDYGQVTRKSTLVAAERSDGLQGAGLALNYQGPRRFFGRATLAHRIGDNPFRNPSTGKDSDGSNQPWRLWVQFGKSF